MKDDRKEEKYILIIGESPPLKMVPLNPVPSHGNDHSTKVQKRENDKQNKRAQEKYTKTKRLD